MQRFDAETETLIPTHGGGFDDLGTTHTLRGEGFDASEDGTGRGTPLVPVAFPAEMSGTQCASAEDICPALSVKHTTAVAFDTTQITSPANYSNPQPGDPCHPLAAGAHAPAIAFTAKDYGADAMEDCSPTLRAGGFADSHQNGGVMPAVAFAQGVAFCDTYNGSISGDIAATLGTQSGDGVSSGPSLLTATAVRRLTPRECERLQGFPDDFTAIPWRGKPADQCPDGPRYKALGNSMAVPVMRWIGERIAAVEAIPTNGGGA